MSRYFFCIYFHFLVNVQLLAWFLRQFQFFVFQCNDVFPLHFCVMIGRIMTFLMIMTFSSFFNFILAGAESRPRNTFIYSAYPNFTSFFCPLTGKTIAQLPSHTGSRNERRLEGFSSLFSYSFYLIWLFSQRFRLRMNGKSYFFLPWSRELLPPSLHI